MEQIIGHDFAQGTTGNLISTLALLVALLPINLVIKLQHFCAQFHCLLINGVAREEPRGIGNEERCLPKAEKGYEVSPPRREERDKADLSRSEVKMVMERLGMYGSGYAGEAGSIGAGEMARLFEEEEVSLEEIKEAFYVFDRNCDGRIDARELSEVMCALGMANVGEGECRDMLRNFDENGDGFIDFREFTKLVERSLRS